MEMDQSEVLVIGSGVAGLVFALTCAEKYQVRVLCKGTLMQTNTALAQGGIAAALEVPDSPEAHYQDTIEAGNGLCDEEAVRFLVYQAGEAIRFLESQGLKFAHLPNGHYDMALEGAHSKPRVVHVRDHTGKSLMETLAHAVRENPNIRVDEFCLVDHLILQKGHCVGASFFRGNTPGSEQVFAPVTMLAAGGAGQVYSPTSNSILSTGDGFALADEAGAELKHMEFVQFHPTLLYSPGKAPFLISEALRGAGAKLCDKHGRPFMEKQHPMGSLAPRDIVSRSITRQMKKDESPCVYLDIRALWSPKLAAHFSTITARCREDGIDPGKDLIPVYPAAHYMCGGIHTDLFGRTSIPGLFASGENACTGVHGANRLASNSLLEGVVFSRSAGEHLLREGLPFHRAYHSGPFSSLNEDEFVDKVYCQIKEKLQKTMTRHAGIIRNEEGLREAESYIHAMLHSHLFSSDHHLSRSKIKVRHMLRTALLIVRAAMNRKTSCGAHFMEVKKNHSSGVLT